jgi:hypothetical protein
MALTLDAFLALLEQRTLPQSPMLRLRTLARELAEGAAHELWDITFAAIQIAVTDHGGYDEALKPALTRLNLTPPETAGLFPRDAALARYFLERWRLFDIAPLMRLMVINGYASFEAPHRMVAEYTLLKPAFDLVEEGPAARVFISYRRAESSAFALLVLARLKAAGVDAFLDMTIQPGQNWQDDLRGRIDASDTFVLLLGKTSLDSDIVLDEISHAMHTGVRIIPIWHNGFVFRGEARIPARMTALLETTHTIRVLEESALGYNNALTELLNYFGVTP